MNSWRSFESKFGLLTHSKIINIPTNISSLPHAGGPVWFPFCGKAFSTLAVVEKLENLVYLLPKKKTVKKYLMTQINLLDLFKVARD